MRYQSVGLYPGSNLSKSHIGILVPLVASRVFLKRRPWDGAESNSIACSSYRGPRRRQKGMKGKSVRVACLLSALLKGFVTLNLGPRSESEIPSNA